MSRTLVLASVLLAGCGFHPVSGVYVITAGESESDCATDTGDTGEGDDTSEEQVTVAEDLESMTIGEGDEALDCSLDGRIIDCPFEPMVVDMSDYGFDAIATVTGDITGEWISDTAFELDMASSVTCEGADCAKIGLEDCEATGTATAELKE
jgi:hypothetical protein